MPSYSLLIYPTTFEETGNVKYYNMDLNKGPLNEMRFTNTYTKSTVKTTKSTRPSESSPNTTAVESTQTGDSSSLSLWLALLAVSAAGVIGTGAYSKKKRSAKKIK